MQAPLSSIASGKLFRTGSSIAPLAAAQLSALDRFEGTERNGRTHPTGWRSGPQRVTGANPAPAGTGIAEGIGLAHDAGNLLGALGLYCDLLARPGVLREEHRHYAEELRLLSGRSRGLIDRLMSPETTERRREASAEYDWPGKAVLPVLPARPREEAVSLPEVIEGCRGLLNVIARRAVAVAYEAKAGLPVAVPRESIERILVNLTKNAAAASAGTGAGAITLRVTSRSTAPGPDRIVLTVEDRGCGMSTAAVKVLLGAGRRALAEPRAEGVHGIGFQVVRDLVGASGGQLRLWSESGCEADHDGAAHNAPANIRGRHNGTSVEITWAVASAAIEPETRPTERQDASAFAVPEEVRDARSQDVYLPDPVAERNGLVLLARGAASREAAQSRGAGSTGARGMGRTSC